LEFVTDADREAIAVLEEARLAATARCDAVREAAEDRESCKRSTCITCTEDELVHTLQQGIHDAAKFDEALAVIAAEKEATAAKLMVVLEQIRREEQMDFHT